MKKIYYLFLLAFSTSLLNAQYYVAPALNAGFNPGNLNTDIEEPHGALTPIGWTIITNTTTTDAWSSVQTIPFNFQFNGQSFNSYKVTNNGVLTFTTSATTVPSGVNTSLPAATIPDNSILIWGLNLSGSNDAVLNKTFGTAPNRQHWVIYASATASGASYTYWSIVLEETSNSVYIVDHRTVGGNVSLTAGLQLDATTAIMINGSNMGSVGSGANNESDNSFYEFIPGAVQPLYDMAGMRGTVAPVVKTGTPVYLTADFWNKGAVAAASYDVNYTINGGTTQTVSANTSLAPGSISNVFHPTQFTPPSSGTYTVEMWLSNINGSADEVPSNDKVVFDVAVVDVVPDRRVVFEEGTGTWCGWCPRGTVAMNYIKANYPNAITIAVHNNDPMEVSVYDAGIALSGYPGSRVDRGGTESVSSSVWDALYQNRIKVVPEAIVKLEALSPAGGANVTVHMSAEFIGNKTGANYKFVTVLKEDGVTGTTSGYAQRNYYANNANGPMGGYENKPDPVPASQMIYDDVARTIHPDYDGEEGSIPSTITAGQKINHTMVVPIPSSVQTYNNVTVVVMVLDGTTGAVVNADQMMMTGTVGMAENNSVDFKMYPNPANHSVKIQSTDDASYEVYDISGKMVANGLITGEYTELNTAEWTNGIYTVKVTSGSQVEIQKLSVLH